MKNGGRALRRLLLLGFGGALVVTFAGGESAQADNGPHMSGAQKAGVTSVAMADNCAGCHRAHNAEGSYLLKSSQEKLCFSCHGSTGTGATTNVVDGVGYTGTTRTGAAGALRGGGFDYALIDTAAPTKETYLSKGNLRARNQVIKVLAVGAPATSKHGVGATATAWGNGALNSGAGAAIALECGSCHNPHGNGNYRILRPVPVDAGAQFVYESVPAKAEVLANPTATPPIAYSPAVPAVMTTGTGINIPDATTKVYTTLNYWLTGDATVPATVSGTPVASPDGFIANVSDWCSTCHTRYRGPKDSYKTDSGDALYKYRHQTTRIDKVGAANCITCHVAHGSNANMNGTESSQVLQPNNTAAESHALGQAGSRLLRVDNRGICVMCHNV